jgi:N-acetylglutamate synthase-like GNAT family acetyltransferase
VSAVGSLYSLPQLNPRSTQIIDFQMNYSIRPALREDATAIRALVRAAFINPLGIHWPRFMIAVDEENRLVGCGQVKVHRDGSRELASIAVAPAWRKQGVASALIERLLAEHAPPLYLTCRPQLGSFYERFGFQVITPDQMPAYFRRVHGLVNWLNRISNRKRGLLVMRR